MGSSIAPIVPSKQANSTRKEPVEGSRASSCSAVGGNMAGASKPDALSTRQQRIAEGTLPTTDGDHPPLGVP